MSVTRLEVRTRVPFAGGHAFGAAEPYERLDGVLHFAVDPGDPANAGIVDLDRAERGPDGRVRFRSDFCLLQPVDAARANRRLLLEVPNRGRKGALGRFNRPALPGAPQLDTGGIGVGDGLLLNHGWTVAWCGWQWDVIRAPTPQAPGGLLGFDAPQALDASGRPIQGQILLQWQPNELLANKLLADRVHQPYPAADPDEAAAVLCYREYPEAPRVEIPRHRWRFARDETGRPAPDATHVWLEGGFRPGLIYDLIYTTAICPVVGAGLLALRDGASFLRYGTAGAENPCAGRLDHVLGFGSSQCGRLLRHFLHLGLNLDEAGRPAFDGLLINVAGARRGEFNHRYAQPSVITIPSFGYQPPFSFDEQTDPLTGQTDGLLRRQRERGGVPKIMATNTSSEYWNREASLLHTDVAGTRDVEPPGEVRVYHFAGTKHGPGALRPDEGEAVASPAQVGSSGRSTMALQPEEGEAIAPPGSGPRSNVVDFQPLLRAALFHLERWVDADVPPPPSVFPRLADGTAARPADALAAYHAIPDVAVPDPDRLFWRRRLDLGPRAEQGVGRYPAREGERYPWYVPAVDGDGNEVAGIRLPDVAVPVATHTGWFPRRPGTGGEGQNTDMMGTTIPFLPNAAARTSTGDSRPAIAERYRDRSEYVTRARAAAQRLVEAGYLLADDLELAVQNAAQRYDAFARGRE